MELLEKKGSDLSSDLNEHLLPLFPRWKFEKIGNMKTSVRFGLLDKMGWYFPL